MKGLLGSHGMVLIELHVESLYPVNPNTIVSNEVMIKFQNIMADFIIKAINIAKVIDIIKAINIAKAINITKVHIIILMINNVIIVDQLIIDSIILIIINTTINQVV